LDALNKLNADFFEYLTEAIRILNGRFSSSKGTGEHLDRWLLEYKLRISG